MTESGHLAVPQVPPDNVNAADNASRLAEQGAGPVRILVVEDDYLIAMQTEDALTEAGFQVLGPAATAEQAVAIARQEQPVLAIMDIRLASKRDGIDAARELFKELDIRCIFATAHDDPATRQRAEPYAPLGWLAKPYSMASLVALVKNAVAKSN